MILASEQEETDGRNTSAPLPPCAFPLNEQLHGNPAFQNNVPVASGDGQWRTFRSGAQILVVVAHPDDEVIGAGALLAELSEVSLLHVTDGAPKQMHDARKAGFATRQQYARARRQELLAAMRLARIAPERSVAFDITDQEASFNLIALAHRMAETLRSLRPQIILTQPYEGGHPDHDATAFVVRAACRLLARNGVAPPAVFEMTAYHIKQGEICAFEFLPRSGCTVHTRWLTAEARTLKTGMIGCYQTQQETLRAFPVLLERVRPAPHYDFTSPPHAGRLFYEHFDWGVTGQQFCRLACEALDSLGFKDGL